jgi:hypothetical protein
MSRVFLSCVTREFGGCRTLLANDLLRAGVDVRVQESFGVGGGTLLESLDDFIRQCDGVVHLIGHGAGAAPEAAALERLMVRYPDLLTKLAIPVSTSISYTQWEAYLALYHDRRIHFYLPEETTPRDPGFSATDDERGSQEEHFGRIRTLGRHRGKFATAERLSTFVLGDLRDLFRADEPFVAEPSTLWKLQTRSDSVFEGREQVLADLDELWADVLAERQGRVGIVSLVAIGGAGKTTVASRWKDAVLAREGNGGVERYFDWSFYSQGTRREGNTGAHTAGDATVFVAAALKFFGDPVMADSAAPAWDKGARLAALASKHRTLLVLDGLEPLQHPPGPQTGELKDDVIRALFEGLKTSGRGLCLVTTREPITDLAPTRETTTPEWPLDRLTVAAGAAVLRRYGVTGPQEELQNASEEVRGHALTLTLMGRYLHLAFKDPDIAKRDCFDFTEADAELKNGHAFRVFAAYERWFESEERHVELAILRLLGLFDRPATPDCIAALCEAPPIPGLTEPLVGLSKQQWTAAFERLRQLDLIEVVEWKPVTVNGYDEAQACAEMETGRQGQTANLSSPQPYQHPFLHRVLDASLDTHPVLREYFEAQLKERDIAPDAHGRLFEHLCASVPFWPEGRDGLLPLYQAVAHGCKAGQFQEALNAVYESRIKRGASGSFKYYSTNVLGLHGLDLAAVACFFVEPWRRLVDALGARDQSWLLSEAGFSLRALNRLTEARDAVRAGLAILLVGGTAENVAVEFRHLAELEVTLGGNAAAETAAAAAVFFADKDENRFVQIVVRAVHAGILHCAGSRTASLAMFAEAEVMQAEDRPDHPFLISDVGHKYCDALLDPAERRGWQVLIGCAEERDDRHVFDFAAIEERAARALDWARPYNHLLSIALDELTLGRVHLLRAVNRNAETLGAQLPYAGIGLDTALRDLRRAGTQHLPRALLPSAWAHALLGDWDLSQQRLDEAFVLATRGGNPQNGWIGGMRLHITDTLLHRARLFGKLKDESRRMAGIPIPPDAYPWAPRTARGDLEEAAALIDACGYHRRDEELADALAAIA